MKTALRTLRNREGQSVERPLQWKVRPLAYCVMAACSGTTWANPVGPQIVSGAVSMVRPDAKTLNVTNSPGSIINWQGFSIGSGEVTRFIQQSSSSAVLNRVVGADISQISGQLLSNGRVFLINPAGIVIGGGAIVDTAGFVASTLNMLDSDFLAGKLRFQGDASSGSIINQGWIKTSSGGNVILVAPTIENSGVIQADGGQIILAAGQKLTIGSVDYEGVQFEVQAPTDSVLNIGKLLADGGAVGVFAGTLKHSGDIRANALTKDEAGNIVLKSQGDTLLSGNSTITATGTKGGSVQVLGNRVGLMDRASIDVSGEQGGGTILVGGDYKGSNPLILNAWRTSVAPDVKLNADAITSGDGGKVIVWADDITRFNGSISARGGAQSGNGGFIETSGKQTLLVGNTARIDAGAPNGAGGSWLLDPKDIRVATGGGATANDVDQFADNTAPEPATVDPATLAAITIGGVNLQASNDITFANALNISANGQALTARAGRSILVQANITSSNSITMTANDAGATGTRDPGAGAITMSSGTTINAGTGIITLNTGTGSSAAATAGDTIITNLTGGHVGITNQGGPVASTDQNVRIVGLVDGTGTVVASPQITVGNNGNILLHIEEQGGPPAACTTNCSSIGTSAFPILISAGSPTNTAILESHYHAGGAGIFIDASSNLQIGGATTVFSIGSFVKGVQALNQTGNGVAPGPVRIVTSGTLRQQAATTGTPAICGANSSGNNGGPICAGTSDAEGTGPNFAGTDSITLRASDMTLQAPINSASVVLLPTTGGTIALGGGTATGTLQLSAGEIGATTITTGALRIGERSTSTGDTTSSGNMQFGGTITGPTNSTLEFRTGGTITTTQGAGTTDIATSNNANITLHAGTGIGATNTGRIKVNPGTGILTADSTSDGVFIEKTGAGAMDAFNYSLNSHGGTLVFELATTDADINMNGVTMSNGDVSIIAGTTATARDINFSGTGTYTNLAPLRLTPTGSTIFDSGTQTFTSSSVTTSRPIIFGGGAATFGQLTTSTANGTLSINDVESTATFGGNTTIVGAMNVSGGRMNSTSGSFTANSTFDVSSTGRVSFNSSTTASIAGMITQSGTGSIIDGTGALTANTGYTFNDGTMSNTGGLATGNAIINTGNPTLSGTLNANRLTMTGGTLGISGTGILRLTSAAAKTISGGTLANAGLIDNQGVATLTIDGTGTLLTNTGSVDLSGGGGLTLSNGGTFDNSGTAALLDIQNANIGSSGAATLMNSGTITKSAGVLTDIGANTNLAFNNTGTLNAAVGTLEYNGTNTFGNGTRFTGGGSNVVLSNSAFNNTVAITQNTNLTLAGPGASYSGNGTIGGTVTWTDGTVTGGLSNPSTGIWNLNGGNVKTINNATFQNAGTMNLNGGALMLSANATLRNTSFFNIVGDLNIQNGGVATFDNSGGGALTKTSGTGTAQIGNVGGQLAFNNSAGGQIAIVANPGSTIDMRGIVNSSSGVIALGAGTTYLADSNFPTNSGTITIANGATFRTTSVPFTNAGNIVMTNGTFLAVAGLRDLNNNNGLIQGTGTINLGGAGTLRNNGGSIIPGNSAGVLNVNGNFTQDANGILSSELGGTAAGTQYDQLRVTGTATLDGTIHVTFINSFTGAPGNTYDVVTAQNGVTNDFQTVNVTPAGTTFSQAITPAVAPNVLQLTQVTGGGGGGGGGGGSSSSSSASDSASMTNTNNVLSDQNRMQQTLSETTTQGEEQPQQTKTRLSTQQCK